MRLLPAPAGSGIVFRRTDLDNFEIPANGRNVAKVSYATSLMRQGVLISTTEHLLSALIGMGVDNVIVELDNLELPILDGSALALCAGVLERGHPHPAPPPRDHPRSAPGGSPRGQQVHRRLSRLRLQHPVHHRFSRAHRPPETPASTWPPRPTATSLRRPHLRLQGRRAALRDMGLIRGANAGERHHPGAKGPENGPLRFADEYVRHKVLDLIGDLALAGRRIEGHVVAERAGHAMHTALVSRLLKDRSAWELARPSASGGSDAHTPF
jgi:UDP-3-O-[3-hydroxymyristoyl] N-acetylglucosamine deacetylase